MARKKKVPNSWESDKPCSEAFFSIVCDSMLKSDAWKQLSSNQKVLYITCKIQGFKRNDKASFDEQYRGNPRYFTMNRYKYTKVYALYNSNNQKGFHRDMDALIEHGFIECVISGRATRSKSLYRFSEKWKKYGTDEFYISPKVRTVSGNNKYNAIKTHEQDGNY